MSTFHYIVMNAFCLIAQQLLLIELKASFGFNLGNAVEVRRFQS